MGTRDIAAGVVKLTNIKFAAPRRNKNLLQQFLLYVLLLYEGDWEFSLLVKKMTVRSVH
jgi:hypothetical protein